MRHYTLTHLSLVVVLAGLTAAAITACGSFKARPDLRQSTLTQSSNDCVKGHQTRQIGTTGAYGTPLVEVTDKPCGSKP